MGTPRKRVATLVASLALVALLASVPVSVWAGASFQEADEQCADDPPELAAALRKTLPADVVGAVDRLFEVYDAFVAPDFMVDFEASTFSCGPEYTMALVTDHSAFQPAMLYQSAFGIEGHESCHPYSEVVPALKAKYENEYVRSYGALQGNERKTIDFIFATIVDEWAPSAVVRTDVLSSHAQLYMEFLSFMHFLGEEAPAPLRALFKRPHNPTGGVFGRMDEFVYENVDVLHIEPVTGYDNALTRLDGAEVPELGDYVHLYTNGCSMKRWVRDFPGSHLKRRAEALASGADEARKEYGKALLLRASLLAYHPAEAAEEEATGPKEVEDFISVAETAGEGLRVVSDEQYCSAMGLKVNENPNSVEDLLKQLNEANELGNPTREMTRTIYDMMKEETAGVPLGCRKAGAVDGLVSGGDEDADGSAGTWSLASFGPNTPRFVQLMVVNAYAYRAGDPSTVWHHLNGAFPALASEVKKAIMVHTAVYIGLHTLKYSEELFLAKYGVRVPRTSTQVDPLDPKNNPSLFGLFPLYAPREAPEYSHQLRIGAPGDSPQLRIGAPESFSRALVTTGGDEDSSGLSVLPPVTSGQAAFPMVLGAAALSMPSAPLDSAAFAAAPASGASIVQFSDYSNGETKDEFIRDTAGDWLDEVFPDGIPADNFGPNVKFEREYLPNSEEAALERSTLFDIKGAANQKVLDDAGGDYTLIGPDADTLVVSVGSSSTQIYSADDPSVTASFDIGTTINSASQADALARAVKAAGKTKVLMINSMGYAATASDPAFVPLTTVAQNENPKLPGVKDIASAFENTFAPDQLQGVTVFNRVQKTTKQLDNNFADGLAKAHNADVVVDWGGSSFKIYHGGKKVFSSSDMDTKFYSNKLLVHGEAVDDGMADYFAQNVIKRIVQEKVPGAKRIFVGQTGEARELHFKAAAAQGGSAVALAAGPPQDDASAVALGAPRSFGGLRGAAPSDLNAVAAVPASSDFASAVQTLQGPQAMPALRPVDDASEYNSPAGSVLTAPDVNLGKKGQAKLAVPGVGTYVADRPGRAETIDYQFIKSGSKYQLTAVGAKDIPKLDDPTWNQGAASRYLPDSPYFTNVNVGLPNNDHASDHLPLDVSYALTNKADGSTVSFKVKQFNILAERAAFVKNFQFAPMYTDSADDAPTEPMTSVEYKKTHRDALLKFDLRKDKLFEEMLEGDPDVLTFEEVDNQAYWQDKLEAKGYTVEVMKRNFGEDTIREKELDSPDKFDGNLIAWKSTRFTQAGAPVHMDVDETGFKKKYERGALVVKLQSTENGAKVVVGAMHVSYDNISPQGLRAQMNDVAQYKAAVDTQTENGEVPVIMNGDYNSVPDSDVIKFVKSQGFESAYAAVKGEEPDATSAYPASVYFQPESQQ